MCKLLGISKFNTTAYHHQCDGAVKQFNRSLLRKQTACHGDQWDMYLSGVLWACRNIPHTSTGKKPSFLLFGVDLHSPTEAAFMPASHIQPADTDDYREQLMLTLKSARELAVASIRGAQGRYKKQYNKHTRPARFRLGQRYYSPKMSMDVGKSYLDPFIYVHIHVRACSHLRGYSV